MYTFNTFLEQKKINPATFKQEATETYIEWEKLFAQMSIPSFTAQKLYFINQIRRRFPIQKSSSHLAGEDSSPIQKKNIALPFLRPTPKATNTDE